MSDYLDKIQTQKKDGTPLATVPFRDSEAREDITTIQNELTTDTTTVEGNPLNFTTLSAQTAKSTILSLEPIQDLHGYDKPWVGGAGKNLLPMTVEGIKAANSGATWTGNSCVIDNVTYTIITDNDGNVTAIKYSGTPSINDTRFYFPNFNVQAGTIRVGGTASTGSSPIYLRIGNASTSAFIDQITLPTYKDITLSENILLSITLRMQSMQGQLQNGSVSLYVTTDTSITTFSTYTNLCPISGRTEIGILGWGKNVLEDTFNTDTFLNVVITSTNGVLDLNGTANSSNSFAIKSRTLTGNYVYIPKGSYIFSAEGIGQGVVVGTTYNNAFREIARNSSGESVSFQITDDTLSDYKQSDGSVLIAFYISVTNGTIYNHQKVYPMLRLASDADSNYESYIKSNDLTISLGQTIYGGTLDVENGVLVVDRGIIGANDFESFSTNTTTGGLKYAETETSGSKASGIGICNIAKVDNAHAWESTVPVAQISSTAGRIRFYCDATDRNDFLTKYANLQVCYELATPITIQLTSNEISLLEGVNNISTTGDKITLTYRDGKVATLGDLTSAVDSLDSKIDESKILTDTVTGDKYILVVTNGVLSVQQISN